MIKATSCITDAHTGGVPRPLGEIEIRDANGQLDRYYTDGYKGEVFVDMRSVEGPPVTGVSLLLYTLFPNGDDEWAILTNREVRVNKHSGPLSVRKHKIACAEVPAGFVMTTGASKAGKPDGKVIFYGPRGLERIDATYVGGKPDGDIRYQRIGMKE